MLSKSLTKSAIEFTHQNNLRHPNIVEIFFYYRQQEYENFEDDRPHNFMVLVMELCEGNLQQYLRKQAITVTYFELMLDCLKALQVRKIKIIHKQ